MATIQRKPIGVRATLTVYLRDNGVCGLCGKHVEPDDVSVDHILPISRGGQNTLDNYQLAHHRCNSAKNNRLPDDERTRPTPRGPRRQSTINHQRERVRERVEAGYVRVEEAALRLGVTPKRLRHDVLGGKIPAYRSQIDKRVLLFREEDLRSRDNLTQSCDRAVERLE
jgi:hypothetical protein